MFDRKPLSLAIGLCFVAVSPAFAADDAGRDGASVDALDAVVVIGEKVTENIRYDLAGSVDVIGRDALDFEHVDDTLELLNKAPGVYLSRYNQGVINTDTAIRGFAGDGSSPHGKLLIDGIPSNLHNGYGELDQMFPLNIGHIQVFKGTSDPRYGLYNIAGHYDVQSRSDVATELQASYGSFNSMELQSYLGRDDGNLRHSYSFGYRSSDGYRDHTDLSKYALSGRWFFDATDAVELGLIARTSHYDGDAPGYLDSVTARTKPQSSASYANQDGGDKTIHHLSGHLNADLSESMRWEAKLYWQTFERERWVRFSEAGSLQNRYDDQTHSGFLSKLAMQVNDAWRVNWGVDVERQDVLEQRFGTVGQSRQRDSSVVKRHNDHSFNTFGTYLQVEHDPNEWLDWNFAYRVDRLNGSLTKVARDGTRTSADMYDFGWIGQPKLNVFLYPSDTMMVFANMGRSFQHPFGASAYTTGDRGARDVSINDGWEVGTHWQPTDAFGMRVSLWKQTATDEYVVVDGTAQNVGETKRDGVDLSMTWSLNEQFLVWGNYSHINSEIVATGTGAANYVGNELRSIPSHTASFGLDAYLSDRLTAKLHVDSQGGYYANEANMGRRFGDFTFVSANIRYNFDWGHVDLQGNNLFDEYGEYVYDFGQTGGDTIHSPMDGRSFGVSLTWKL